MSEEVYYGTASIATGMPGLPPLRPVRDAPQRRFGQGAAHAEVMLVGEGPGANEDEQGLPFVGKSGQLLDHYLEAVDLSRDKKRLYCQYRQMPPAAEPRSAAGRIRRVHALAAPAISADPSQNRCLSGPRGRAADARPGLLDFPRPR